LVTLDALRGLAVMGILAMNIVGFAMPEMAYVTPAAYGGTAPIDLAAWAASMLLFDGKMRGLFSILFGASMLLIIDRAESKGESGAGVHFRRMAWLALFGLAHFFFIWFGDILFLYASAGCLAFLFRRRTPRGLIIWALSLFAIGNLLMAALFGTQLYMVRAADQPGAPEWVVKGGSEIRKEMAKLDKQVADEVTLHRQGFTAIARDKLEDKTFQPLAAVLMTILETLPLMLIGMAMFKSGFLTGAWDVAAYRRVAWRTLPLGAALTIAVILIQYRSGFDFMVVLTSFMAGLMIPRLLMTIGFAALLILLIRHLDGSALLARVSAAGRAAFTNYLGTSILMTFIFYGWGLGLFGHVERAALYLFVIGAWAVMLLWSKPWLERFHYGPFEWVWRSLARGKMQPMVKRAPGSATF
jgi:uncharacterized protein